MQDDAQGQDESDLIHGGYGDKPCAWPEGDKQHQGWSF